MTEPHYLPPEEAKNLLAGILLDFAEDGAEQLGNYLVHIGFDISAISSTAELLPAFFGHYRIGQGAYDTDRAAHDLLTWPPIAAEAFRQLERRGLDK